MSIDKVITPQDALKRAQALCSRAEHCSGEIREKLRKWGINELGSQKIVSLLIQNRFIDDRRYALSFVNDKVYLAHWGRKKVSMALKMKRVDSEIICQVLQDIDERRYEETLVSLLKAKIKSNPALLDSYEGRTKLFRFALSRGFESSLIAIQLKFLLFQKGE